MQPSTRAQILTRRTYNRPLDDAGTAFETWAMTVDRSIDHQSWLWERAQGGSLAPAQAAELDELRGLMLARKASVSGRSLWLGGTPLVRRREASCFNCSYLDVRTVHDLVDAFWLLLQGCGVGFRPINGALSGFTRKMKVEVVRSTREGAGGQDQNGESYDPATGVWTITVGDSAEAWAKSVGKVVAGKFPAKTIRLDLSPIRAAGSRLKGYGWICTGDAGLATALEAICGVMNARVGKLLSKNDITDVVNWMGAVLSNRRSAQIALIDFGDDEWEAFATRKYKGFDGGPDWFRGQSNNSLVFWERPSKKQLRRLFDIMIANGGAEPGLINGHQAKMRAPWMRGVNPCSEILLADKGFCVAGDTLLITRDGMSPISELVGRRVDVWNGLGWSSVVPRVTGVGRELYRVYFSDGSYLDCTADHRFSVRDRFMGEYAEVKARDLMDFSKYAVHAEPTTIDYDDGEDVPDAYTLGVLVGDGGVESATGKIALDLYGAKMALPVAGRKSAEAVKPGYGVASVAVSGLAEFDDELIQGLKDDPRALESLASWSRRSILEFLAGWLDADGSETGTGGVRLYLADYSRALRVQLLLTKCGIRSSVNLHQKAGAVTNYGARTRDSYYVQVTDCGDIPCHRLDTSRGHAPARKGKHQVIRAVVPLGGEHTVYCFNEPERHKAVFGNVLTYQCNLVEVDVAGFRGDDPGLRRAVEIMSRANYRQTAVNLRDGVLQDAWHQQNEYLRLCGVGLTGIARRPDLTSWDYRQLKNAAVAAAYGQADELHLERPKNVTCVKPSGTLSKAIFDTTEGAHRPKGRHIFNTVSFSKDDPLVPMMLDAGYRVTGHPHDRGAVLVVLPVSYPDVAFQEWNGYEVDRESAVDQLDRYCMLQRAYVEQNTSVTISYDPDELKGLIDAYDRRWDDIVGCSFLFRDDPTKTAEDLGFAYMPQRVVGRAEYEGYAASLGPVDIEAVEERGIFEIDAASECASGVCPVK